MDSRRSIVDSNLGDNRSHSAHNRDCEVIIDRSAPWAKCVVECSVVPAERAGHGGT